MGGLLLGLGIGIGAGLSPGAMLTFVLTTTLRRGFRVGALVALSPLLGDAPIILLSLLFVGSLPAGVAQGLGIVGGLVVIWLGVETIRGSRHASLATPTAVPAQRELLKGILINLVNPHPWLFWLTVGGATTIEMWRRSPIEGIAFVAGFYVTLIGAKISVAAAVALGRKRLNEHAYRRLLVGAGGLMIGVGALLIVEFTRL